MDDTEILQNSNLCRITYAAIREVADEFYEMELVGEDAEVCVEAVNMGIDSRLQACSIKGRDSYEWVNGRLVCSVSKESLPVLIRRLIEDTEEGYSLGESILTTLGFDDCGKYVGREALGL